MTKVNELGQQILKAKYYAPGETEPEHLFRRVAKVCSIPDVVDYLIQSSLPYDVQVATGDPIIGDIQLNALFGDYDYLAKRVIARRGVPPICVQSRTYDVQEISELWDKRADCYFEAMANLDFMPASPTLMNAGLGGMLSSCFAIRIPDSMEGIFEVVKQVAIISQKGGGVGLQMSDVRPEGYPVGDSGGTASGPISFMKVFNESGNQVKQGGKRAPALLGGLDVTHPDIMKFIECKKKEGELSNFNMSVFVSDDFMKAVKGGASIELKHNVLGGATITSARTIWKSLMRSAWKNGEPGIIFQGNLDKDDVVKGRYGKLLVNPCVVGSTFLIVKTDTGYRSDKICEHVDKEVEIWNGIRWTKVTPRLTGKNRDIIRITVVHSDKTASQLCCTYNHRFILHDKSEVEAKDLMVGNVLDSWACPDGLLREGSFICEILSLSKPEDVYCFTDLLDGCGMFGGIKTLQCAELPLHNYSSCNLASINLSNCVKGDSVYWEKLENLVALVTRFLDNVVDLNNYPLPQIEDMTLKLRPIGVGSMGLHDLLLKMEIEYGSEKSLTVIDNIYKMIELTSIAESRKLGKLRGVPQELKDVGLDRRNGFLRTVPPTGTISMIANQVSSGIEPVFQWEYTRNDTFGTHKMRHFMLDKYGLIDKLPSYAKTSTEISPEAHVKVQATVQKYLDESVSKTVNMPNSATVEDVEKVYMTAYDLGCKSVTVYRSGSRENEVLSSKEEEVKPEAKPVKEEAQITGNKLRERPRVLFGCTMRIPYGGGTVLYVTINEDKQGVREVFAHVAKVGSEISSHVETEGRFISNSLKYNIPVEVLIRQLGGIRSNPTFSNGKIIRSIPDALSQALQEYVDTWEGFSQFIEDPILAKAIEYEMEQTDKDKFKEHSGDICPECGELMFKEGGCEVCKSCGNSKCG